jgi:bifunctional non-homologous end joining protein LigD
MTHEFLQRTQFQFEKNGSLRRERSRLVTGQFEFLEWTPDDHLRHSRFVGLREDKKAKDIVREYGWKD